MVACTNFFHFFIGVCSYIGRKWELSYRLAMRPWICITFSAPVAAAAAVFVVYPIGQRSLSDGMPLDLGRLTLCWFFKLNITF